MAYLQDSVAIKVSTNNEISLPTINTNQYDTSQIQTNVQLSMDKISSYISKLSYNVSIVNNAKQLSASAGSPLPFTKAVFDKYSTWDTTKWKFKSPVSGVVELSMCLILTSGSSVSLKVYVNGVSYGTVYTGTPSSEVVYRRLDIPLSSGDSLWVAPTAACTLGTDGALSQISVRW